MTQTILQKIWDKTLEKLANDDTFESHRIDEIKQALSAEETSKVQTILSKQYEDQETSD